MKNDEKRDREHFASAKSPFGGAKCTISRRFLAFHPLRVGVIGFGAAKSTLTLYGIFWKKLKIESRVRKCFAPRRFRFADAKRAWESNYK